ncbi:MAG: cytochrome c [Verrucomicrobia bacterium]|nr:cytochrome c [Verrucomicrobiota bacterium]
MKNHFGAGRLLGGLVALAGLMMLGGCNRFPGQPRPEDRWVAPSTITDFATLYQTNCVACHSNGKPLTPAIAMNNPLYVAIIPRDTLRKVISEGIQGSLMPAFEAGHNGDLTREQVDSLVNGITAWGKTDQQPAAGGNLPPYAAAPGDAKRGEAAYGTYCAGCHNADGNGGPKGGSVVNPDYLHLVSDQYLRSVVIAGRPELGMPNYQQLVPNKPMSPEEISDVVAWLVSHRRAQNPEVAAAAPPGSQPPSQ